MSTGAVDSKSVVLAALDEARRGLEALMKSEKSLQAISDAATVMIQSLERGGTIHSCGNGGSMCDAMHFAEELTGRYRKNRPGLRALSISDASHMSCVGNDYGYDLVFARWVESHGRPGDVLLAISTSGRSRNVILATEAARRAGMKIVALTGKPGSELGALVDVDICTPAGSWADRVQELHIKVIHILIELIERKFSPENYTS